MSVRRQLPVRAVVRIRGATAGRPLGVIFGSQAARAHRGQGECATTLRAHQLRHTHAVEMAHEGVPLVVIQRQLGHANLGITSIYLQGIDSSEIIDTSTPRPGPVIPATAGLESTF